MLLLSRKVGERIVVGENITIEVIKIKGNRITLGLNAPADVTILRGELTKPSAKRVTTTVECEVIDGMLVAG